MSNGIGRDEVAVGYGKPTPPEVARAEMKALAAELRSTVQGLKVSSDEGITVVEAKLTGLTNWKTGQVNLDVLNHAFRRARFFRITCFFLGPFPVKPQAEWVQGPLRIRSAVQLLDRQRPEAGRIVDYQVWVDQSRGVPTRLPSVTMDREGRKSNALLALTVALATVAVVAGILFFVRAARRRENN